MAFVFCTGYHYRFPFLAPAVASVHENWVQGLYRQLVPVDAPRCAFIGLTVTASFRFRSSSVRRGGSRGR